MRFVEMSIEDAMKKCKKGAIVLVAEQDLEKDDCNVVFVAKKRKDYDQLFKDVKTAASVSDDFIKQLLLFTVHQDIPNIKPVGRQKTVLLKE